MVVDGALQMDLINTASRYMTSLCILPRTYKLHAYLKTVLVSDTIVTSETTYNYI